MIAYFLEKTKNGRTPFDYGFLPFFNYKFYVLFQQFYICLIIILSVYHGRCSLLTVRN